MRYKLKAKNHMENLIKLVTEVKAPKKEAK